MAVGVTLLIQRDAELTESIPKCLRHPEIISLDLFSYARFIGSTKVSIEISKT